MKDLKKWFLSKKFKPNIKNYFNISKKIQIQQLAVLLTFFIVFFFLFLIQIFIFKINVHLKWIFIVIYIIFFYLCSIYLIWYLVILKQINIVLLAIKNMDRKLNQKDMIIMKRVYYKLSFKQFSKKTIGNSLINFNSKSKKEKLIKIVFFIPFYSELLFSKLKIFRIKNSPLIKFNYNLITDNISNNK